MARGDWFPNYNIEVDDASRRPLAPPAPDGLHMPIFFGFAPRGPINIPVRGNGSYIMDTFGDGVFNSLSKYFKHQNIFAREAASVQEIYFVRVIDPAATTASIVIEATVTQVAAHPIYATNADGTYALASDGTKVAKLDGSNAAITAPGLSITWAAREIGWAATPAETFDTLTTTKLAGTAGSKTGTYPVAVFTAESEGGFSNLLGFKIYFDRREQDEAVNEATDSILLTFEPVFLNELTNSPVGIRDIDDVFVHAVSLKKDAFDNSTQTFYDWDRVAERKYTRTHGGVSYNSLRMNMRILYDNIKEVQELVEFAGDLVKADAAGAQGEFADTTYSNIDIFTGQSTLHQDYEHLAVTGDVFKRTKVHYLTGGSDGDITDLSYNNLVQSFLDKDTTPFPEIRDEARYPITHLYDSGFTFDCKKEFINFMGIRKDVKIDVCTQDWANPANDADMDQSVGAALRTAARLHPESTFFGTEVMRCAIYQQTGTLTSDQNIKKKVPLLLDRLLKRCRTDASNKVLDIPTTLTGIITASVDIFSDISWTPSSDDRKRKSWSSGLNYVQFYDRSRVHFPDYRTVHPFDTSVLSDEIAVDYLVYISHICRYVWAAFYTGSREPSERLYQRIQREVDQRIYNALDGRVVTNTTLFQTDTDRGLGFSDTMNLSVNFPSVRRVLNIIIPVGRLD